MSKLLMVPGGGLILPAPYRDYPLTIDARDVSPAGVDGTIFGAPSFGANGVTFGGDPDRILIPSPGLTSGTLIVTGSSTETPQTGLVSAWQTSIAQLAPLVILGASTGAAPDESLNYSILDTDPAVTLIKRVLIQQGHNAYLDGAARFFGATVDPAGPALVYTDGMDMTSAELGGAVQQFFTGADLSLGARRLFLPGATVVYYKNTVFSLKWYVETFTPEQMLFAYLTS